MNNKERQIFINLIHLIYKNCQKNLAKIEKVDLTSDASKDFIKKIEPYVYLATEFIFSSDPYLDLDLYLDHKNEIKSLKFKNEKSRIIKYEIFDKYLANECIIPHNIKTNSRDDGVTLLVLLVNFMALYDLNEENEKFFHECLIKLFLVLFGNRFYDIFNDVDSIGRLYEFKSAYIQICKNNDCEKIIEFVYGANLEIEQTLFESYNTILHLDEEVTNLVPWALRIDTNNHYIDATEFLKIIELIKNKQKCKIQNIHLPIITKESKAAFSEEGYYGMLLNIFTHNNITKNEFEKYPDDLDNISLVVS